MPISMPAAPGFIAARFGLETNTQRFESPLTRAVQRVKLSGDRWTATYTLPVMTRAQMAAWQSFFLQLEGSLNTFAGFDPDARTPRGAATGTPLVNGASQTGSTLTIDGCAASVTNWLMAGDYFVQNGQMHLLTAPANTNGSGQATLNFKPAMRTSPADNAPLTVTHCTVPMVLVDDGQSMWSSGKRLGVYDALSFSGVEVF